MTSLGRTYTFSDSDKFVGSRVDLEIQALNNIWNNHDSALLAWTKLNVSGTTKFNGGTYTWPATLPGATSILQTTSGGTLSWATALGAYGPVGSAYVTIGSDSTLTSERALTQGTGISVTDGGAGSTVTIANTGVTSLTGTANRVTVSAASGAVTLNGPQDLATGSSPTFVGGTFTGTVDGPGQLKGKGTATNDSAAAGYIGEYIESLVTTNTSVGSSGQFADLASINLTAGDWDISGLIWWVDNGATFTATDVEWGISTTTGNSSTGLSLGVNYFTTESAVALGTNDKFSTTIPVYRVSLSTTTTHYLKGLQTYTAGTPKYRCRLSARRVR